MPVLIVRTASDILRRMQRKTCGNLALTILAPTSAHLIRTRMNVVRTKEVSGGRQQHQHHHRRQNASPEARWRQTLEETL